MTIDVLSYIKSKYPRIIFTPLRLINGSPKRSLGFVISDNKFVMGYITKEGSLCKLIEPIDLNFMSHEQFIKVLNNIPLAIGFNEEDKTKLLNILQDKESISLKEHNKVINELKKHLVSKDEKKYGVLYNDDKILLVKKKYASKLEAIKQHYEKDMQEYQRKIEEYEVAHETCKSQLLQEKENVIQTIKNFKKQMSDYISEINKQESDKNVKPQIQEMYDKLIQEKAEIESAMLLLVEKEKQYLQNIQDSQSQLSQFGSKLENKEAEISELHNVIAIIKEELETLRDLFSKKELENIVLAESKKVCLDMILNENDKIIEGIKEYNNKWLEWVKNNNYNIEEQKEKLKNDLDIIYRNIKDALASKDKYIEDLNLSMKEKDILLNKLKSNISDIKIEVGNSLNEQLLQLSLRNQELESSIEERSKEFDKKNKEIKDLKEQLNKVKDLLDKNAITVIPKKIDYKDCYATLKKFINVNNMFFRKSQIISILDNLINSPGNVSFDNLNESLKNNITNEFENVKQEINKHINFMDLAKYINNPNVELFKSKATLKNIPDTFCEELNNISMYWDNNINLFMEQDRILTNIYEDLSGAVRVYIRIKPLIGQEQRQHTKTVYSEGITKNVTIECLNKKKTFGEFYGVFNDTFSNKDIYTGIQGSGDISDLKIENLDELENVNSSTISPGLYNIFKQIEDGYSIVLFGYGLSGSGKTTSLIGNGGIPGLLHYGLANLNEVSNIKVKYLFEQYIDKFVPTINNIRGQIVNLVNEVPQLKNYSVNEQDEFLDFIKSQVNLNNITPESITELTYLLESYRKNMSRIKKTPNNPMSSRSHLYIVFEIKFNTGNIGYMTIIDTAGQESPVNIFNMFIDTSKKVDLTTILGPTGGPGVVKKYLKPQYIDWSPNDIYDILNEGVYINETLNHLIYFFNKKNYKQTNIRKISNMNNYSIDKYYVDPRYEEESINPVNNCLTIPILKFLDAISIKKQDKNKFKPTKFIALVCVRQDEKYCSQSVNTLEFAEKIKSS